MEPHEQEPAGDYGYDMAHEDVGRPPRPAEPPRREPGRGTAPRRTPDLDQDYGYDEAHSF